MTKYLLILLILFSCTRAPLKNLNESMRIADFTIKKDDCAKENLVKAIKESIRVLRNNPEKILNFGPYQISKKDYANALEDVLNNQETLVETLNSKFELLEVYGRKKYGEVLITGYYQPRIQGSKNKTEFFTQPLYALPEDIVYIKLDKFQKIQNENKDLVLTARVEGNKVLPYYTRKEIDEEKKLANKKLELVWVNPIDAFFLQIQGSGYIDLSANESLHLGYAGQNGHPYFAIGSALKDKISEKEMSMQAIRKFLETLPHDEKQKILNLNPSFVFFKKIMSEAETSSGIPAIDRRVIATDGKFFPKGALAYLKSTISCLVIDADVGGAIKGGGRVDWYIGSDKESEEFAGKLKEEGKLYYLFPKSHLN